MLSVCVCVFTNINININISSFYFVLGIVYVHSVVYEQCIVYHYGVSKGYEAENSFDTGEDEGVGRHGCGCGYEARVRSVRY